MRLLFFDMEFADGKVPGSIYSIGYLITDEDFRVLVPPTDLLIDPESTWNDYVVQNILAYPMEEIKEAPPFPQHYSALAELFSSVDVAVGFSVNNDNRALLKDCQRYALPPLSYAYFDVEKLCRVIGEHPKARGLGGCHAAWCGEDAQNPHRSDGDAYTTMQLLRAICRSKHATAQMMLEAYSECGGTTSVPKASQKAQGKKRRRRRGGKNAHNNKTTSEAKKGETA